MRRLKITVALVFSMLLGSIVTQVLWNAPPVPKAHAASASATITGVEATLECDSTIVTATKSVANMSGYLVNGGSNNVFVNFAGDGTCATTDAQNLTGTIKMTPGSTITVRKTCTKFSYKAGAATSVLYWFPEE